MNTMKKTSSILNKILTHKDLILLGLILLLGSLLRLVSLTSLPGGVHQDEATVALNAWNLFNEGTDLSGNVNPIYMADWGDGHSALYVWLTLPFYLFTGGKWTLLASRLPQAVVGILTILAVYGICTELFDRKMGLLSALILATCPWHIMMSRWGLDANLAPGCLAFSLFFFMKAINGEKTGHTLFGSDASKTASTNKMPLASSTDSSHRKPTINVWLLLAAISYGLALYSYASIWVAVPVLLLCMGIYSLAKKKLSFDRSLIISIIILGLLATPLLLFLLVNNGFLPELRLRFFTIPLMKGYRGESMSMSPSELLGNLRSALYLLRYQKAADGYSIISTWGLFYRPIGDLLIVFGVLLLLVNIILKFFRRQYATEFMILAQLVGAAITCTLTGAQVQRINCLYIPLLLCEAYGIWSIIQFLTRHFAKYQSVLTPLMYGLTAGLFLILTGFFWRDYSSSYNDVASAYFGQGIQEAVALARNECKEKGLSTISVEQAAQWPRILLFTETPASTYLDTVEYDETFLTPAPKSFYTTDNIRINTRVDFNALSMDSVYIIYSANADMVREYYTLLEASPYWYVAVPK